MGVEGVAGVMVANEVRGYGGTEGCVSLPEMNKNIYVLIIPWYSLCRW